jgi:hypothetical protein
VSAEPKAQTGSISDFWVKPSQLSPPIYLGFLKKSLFAVLRLNYAVFFSAENAPTEKQLKQCVTLSA